LWIERESDDRACRVRDYENMLSSPTGMDDQMKEKSSQVIQDDSCPRTTAGRRDSSLLYESSWYFEAGIGFSYRMLTWHMEKGCARSNWIPVVLPLHTRDSIQVLMNGTIWPTRTMEPSPTGEEYIHSTLFGSETTGETAGT
jgi:hypothetical protein